MDLATPANRPSTLRSAAVKAVFPVNAALVVHRPAPSVELALLGIQTMLLVTIGSLVFVLMPIMVAMHRLPIHLSANVFHYIAWSFRVRPHGAQRKN